MDDDDLIGIVFNGVGQGLGQSMFRGLFGGGQVSAPAPPPAPQASDGSGLGLLVTGLVSGAFATYGVIRLARRRAEKRRAAASVPDDAGTTDPGAVAEPTS
jgi:hypothetical protein